MYVPFKLSKDIKLGVATASCQIEGDNKNNNWYRFSLTEGNVKDNTTPDIANQHYKLFKEDTMLMKKMGLEIYRMGVEWSRIEPEQGKFDQEVIKHYKEEISLCQKQGIDVLVTLHHFSNPLWFEDMGAFTNKDAVKIFLNFVQYVVNEFKGLVHEYCTINEANIYAYNSYLTGYWPPKEKSVKKASLVMKTLCLCHIEAYKLIKSIDPNCKVGFANHMADFTPENPNSKFDKFIANIGFNAFNESINKAMAYGVFTFPMGHSKKYKGEYIDFFGVNYYTNNMVKGLSMHTKEDCEHNDLGWEINYESLRKFCIRFYKEYKKDIYITENGTADRLDAFRAKYIYDHLKAISDLDFVKRYYHWTFMDNWEWAEGQTARFGLVECDFETQKRTIRPSGNFYSEIIKNKEVTEKMIKKYLEK